MSVDRAPLWLRSLAWSAGYVGHSASEITVGLAPELRASLELLLAEIPAGNAHARARALAERRTQWLRASRPALDDGALSKLGARIIASMIASTPSSARAALARSFEAESLRAATIEVRAARSCDSLALQSLLDAITRATHKPPSAVALGAVAFAALVDDTDAPRVAIEVLRALRSRAEPLSALAPFAEDARAILAENTG